MSGDDHDVLIRIDTNLTTFMEQFKAHEKKDEERFKFLEHMAYGIFGAFLFIEVAVKLLN